MFYYPNVLQRHTGCFATIWLAATRGTKILKREYMKVNVISTCEKIIEYILIQVPAPYVGSPIPRLSLYLSAQLSFGVVCVYHRQCDLLIEEMKNTLDRLHRAEKQMRIDLMQSEQQSLIPNALVIMEMLEDAPDPFFGIMGIPPELPDPFMIPQLQHLLKTPSPELSRMDKTPPRWRRARKHEESDHMTSPESITLREVEPLILPTLEVVPDLPEVTARDLEFLMSNIPPFPEEITHDPHREERTKPGMIREKPKPKPKEGKRVTPKEPDMERETQIGRDEQVSISEREQERIQEADKEREYQEAVEKERKQVEELEREIERLREQERQSEQQQEAEKERKMQRKTKREKEHQQETEREKDRLRKALKEIKRLKKSGAEEEILKQKTKEIEHLKKLQKEREEQWEAEKSADSMREYETEMLRLQEAEREREQLREAVREIEQLKKDLEERAQKKVKESEGMMDITEESSDIIRKMEAEPLTPKLSPTTRLPSEALPEPEATIVLDDITGEPIALFPDMSPDHRSLQHFSPLLLTSSSPQLLLPDLSPVRRSPTWHAVKKGQLIIDKNTQISRKQMQEQMSEPSTHTHAMVPVAIPHLKFRTLPTLFNSPTYSRWMAPELSALWSRCAVLEQLQFIEEIEEETMSELEAVRAATESAISGIMPSSEFSLEVSEEERSRLIYITPEEKRYVAPQDERFLPIVSEMPELIVELPETEEVLVEDLQRKLYSQIDSHGQSAFFQLTPRSLSRKLVSRFFYRCLVLCTRQIIRMEQAEPYGQILITSGLRYTHD
ncbi:meiotic recombination protein REC8 homolog [Pelobates fuscus]|uniref:meiotic recombination protein REC8 homolog n=1 Tax=Pelobates fuscus TaxID=191477 RepID=UPI002FE4CC77